MAILIGLMNNKDKSSPIIPNRMISQIAKLKCTFKFISSHRLTRNLNGKAEKYAKGVTQNNDSQISTRYARIFNKHASYSCSFLSILLLSFQLRMIQIRTHTCRKMPVGKEGTSASTLCKKGTLLESIHPRELHPSRDAIDIQSEVQPWDSCILLDNEPNIFLCCNHSNL
jgi:hypothetical protein